MIPGCRGVRSPSARCKSVRHTPQTRTFSRTSPRPGMGSGRSAATRGPLDMGPGSPTCQARTAASFSAASPGPNRLRSRRLAGDQHVAARLVQHGGDRVAGSGRGLWVPSTRTSASSAASSSSRRAVALAQDAGNLQPGCQSAGLVDGVVEQLLAVVPGMAAVLLPRPAAQRIDVDEVQRGAEDFGQPDGLGHRGWAAGRGIDAHHDGVSAGVAGAGSPSPGTVRSRPDRCRPSRPSGPGRRQGPGCRPPAAGRPGRRLAARVPGARPP